MDTEYRDLTNRLFAAATAMLEDAALVAVAGQSGRRSPAALARDAETLQQAGRDIAVIAEAALIVARLDRNERRTPVKSRR